MINGIYGNDFRHMYNAINTFGVIPPGLQKFPNFITTKQNGNQFTGPFLDPLLNKIAVSGTGWTYYYQTPPPLAYWVYDCRPSSASLTTPPSLLPPFTCICTAPAAPPIHLFAMALSIDSSLLGDQLEIAAGSKEYASDKDELWLYNDQEQLYSNLQLDSGTGIAELDSFKTANLNSGIGIQDSFSYYMAGQKEEQFAAKNISLLTGNIIDSLEGEINKELMYKLHSWEYNQLDTNKIISIANLCPYLYGSPVYRARSILHKLRGYDYYFRLEEDDCESNPKKDAYRRMNPPQVVDSTTSEQKDSIATLSAHPNPSHHRLSLVLSNYTRDLKSEKCYIKIVGSTGEVIQNDFLDLSTGYGELDVSALANGIYLLILKTPSHEQFTLKFIKD